jgi:signal transduction histidine kinase
MSGLTPSMDEGEIAEREAGAEAGFAGEHRTGAGVMFDVRQTPYRNARAAFSGRIVRFTDITALKLAMRQREQALQLLSHDMRSPQISIIALLEEAPRAAEDPSDKARRIGGYARRTLALADNFVQLARAENPHYAFEILNLPDMLLDAADELWPQARAKGVTVRTVGCEDERLVRADRSLLTRVLINIIDNAVKYSPAGGVVDCRIEPTPDPSNVQVVIADQGPGMNAEQLSHLFEPFRRAPQGRSGAGGVGLGLTFARTVILRHEGLIECGSRPGGGTAFTLTLPLAASDLGAP